MADNIQVSQGTGTVMATDDIGGVQFPRVKVSWGVDGSAVDASASNPFPVQGTVTANAGTGSFTVAQATAANLNATVVGTGTFAVQAAQSGTWNIGNVTGTVSLPTGAATAAKQPALGTAGTPSADVLTVQGSAAMTALKVDGSAVTQPVSGTVTANAGTGSFTVAQPTASNLNATVVGTGTFAVQAAQSGTWNIGNITGTVSLPTGAATAAKQPALGSAGTPSSDVLTVQGAVGMTALRVDGSAVTQPVSDGNGSLTVDNAGTFAVQATQAGTWNINNVSGTISLPTGAATDSTVSTMSGKLPATLGQKTMANSMAVVVASDQSAVPVSGTVTANAGTGSFTVAQATAANLNATVVGTGTFAVQAAQSGTWNVNNITGTVSLPTGAATSAAQTTGNASLASLDTKLPAQSITGLLPVDTLASMGVSRLVSMGSASANIALTPTTRRVSIHATVAGFFAVGTGVQTASSTSHYIGAGERLDFDVAANTQIAAIRSTIDGTLYISELLAT